MLLAVDLGLRTGTARFGADGRLVAYGSHHYGTTDALRRDLPRLLAGATHLALEGGGALALVWTKEAERRALPTLLCHAHEWRADLLLPRERAAGGFKERAVRLAAGVIAADGAPRPRGPLRHDAAEAILMGAWAAHRVGLRSALPR